MNDFTLCVAFFFCYFHPKNFHVPTKLFDLVSFRKKEIVHNGMVNVRKIDNIPTENDGIIEKEPVKMHTFFPFIEHSIHKFLLNLKQQIKKNG